MSDFHETQHGKNHRVSLVDGEVVNIGSDFIPGLAAILNTLQPGIRYETDNDDGWLSIKASDEVPGGDNAIEITTTAGAGSGDFDIATEGHFKVESDGGIILTDNSGNDYRITSGGHLVSITDGETYVINDHLGSPLVTYTG